MTQYVQHDYEQDVSIFRFNNLTNIDANTAHRVKAEIRGFLDNHPNHVIISFKGINFVDSTGFGALISILKSVKTEKKRIILCELTDEVMELMDLMQLLNVFEVKETVNEAKALLTN